MLPQQVMIERVREICERDERLVAALMYGSFALLQGDLYSDIGFYFFFRDERLDEVDEERWVEQIAPVELYYVNEFGKRTSRQPPTRGSRHAQRCWTRTGRPALIGRCGSGVEN